MPTPPVRWPSYTGTITRLKEGRGPSEAFVVFTLSIPKKDGGTFHRDAIAFRDAMETIQQVGLGGRVYIRGPLSHTRKTNATGQAYTITSIKAITVRHIPLPALGTAPETEAACT